MVMQSACPLDVNVHNFPLQIINIPNSMTVLPELLPLSIKMVRGLKIKVHTVYVQRMRAVPQSRPYKHGRIALSNHGTEDVF